MFNKYEGINMIDSFSGKYDFLSNFYYSPFVFKDIFYPTVEHAFQAAKTNDIDQKIRISRAETQGMSKVLGGRVKLRDDWEDAKISVMRQLLFKKFDPTNHPFLVGLLKMTDPHKLVEGNTWHDNIWGNCTCHKCQNIIGQNNLGKLLMEVRGGILT